MNQQIKELAIEAGLGLYRPSKDEWSFSKNEEKFAELMLTEFKSVLLNMMNEGQGEFDTLDQALTEINEHFVVEV
jgi:hypothetical protein